MKAELKEKLSRMYEVKAGKHHIRIKVSYPLWRWEGKKYEPKYKLIRVMLTLMLHCYFQFLCLPIVNFSLDKCVLVGNLYQCIISNI